MKPSAVLQLAAFSRCLHPAEPMEGMYFDGGGDLVLTDGGRAVAERLGELATEAIRGPEGMGPHRPVLFLAQRSFASGEGEACAAAAVVLGDVATELLDPATEPDPDELSERTL